MSQEPQVDLAVRREQLRLRSAQLREQIAVRSAVFRPAFRATDRVRGGVHAVRKVTEVGNHRHAFALLAGSALVGALLVRPRVAARLGLRAWSGWQMFRRLRPVVNTVLRQLG